MALKPGKCTSCGELFEIDSEKRLSICKYCNEPFVVDEAINNFTEYFNISIIYNSKPAITKEEIFETEKAPENDFVIQGGVLLQYRGKESDVVIPDGVVEIGGAFTDSLIIKNVKIPDSVTRIGDKAFLHCANLVSVNIPQNLEYIGDWAFGGCDKLTNLSIPASVKHIGSSAFANCTALSVNLQYNETELGVNCLNTCKDVSVEAVGAGVIKQGAFKNNEKVTSLKLSDSIRGIEKNAFYGCTGLTSINVPGTVRFIERYAFVKCNLQSIDINKSISKIDDFAFYGVSNKLQHLSAPECVCVQLKKCSHCLGDLVEKGFMTLYYQCESCGRKYDE